MLTSRGTGRDDGTVETGLGDDVDLNGRVTARIVDRTRVDLGNSHGGIYWWGRALAGGQLAR